MTTQRTAACETSMFVLREILRFFHKHCSEDVSQKDTLRLTKTSQDLTGRLIKMITLLFLVSKRANAISPPGGTWVFFEWVCAALDSKLAPRFKKKIPLKLIPSFSDGSIFYTPF